MTFGIIYETETETETDGLNFYNEYGMLRELSADPALSTSPPEVLGKGAEPVAATVEVRDDEVG